MGRRDGREQCLRAGGARGIAAFGIADGERKWSVVPGSAPDKKIGYTAAVTTIPGVLFVGASDGGVWALASNDGHPLWSYQTGHAFTTVNAVAAHGGSIASAGATVAGGLLLVAPDTVWLRNAGKCCWRSVCNRFWIRGTMSQYMMSQHIRSARRPHGHDIDDGSVGNGRAGRCGALDAPPTAMVPSTAEVVRAGHLGREIGDTEPLIHFYSDLIGLELTGARTAPRPFFVRHGLQEFAELGEDDDVYKSSSRVALVPIPGTAATVGGPEMTIEAIEIKGVKSRPYHPALRDPGASYLKIIVRDIDKTLALLKDERYTVITQGDAPWS